MSRTIFNSGCPDSTQSNARLCFSVGHCSAGYGTGRADAELPKNPLSYFISLAVFIAVSLSIASIIGLAVKDQAKTSMFSIIIFIPSTMLSGIMFPMELLPEAFATIGKLFPASWGYKLMTEHVFKFESLLPFLLFFVLAVVLCNILLRRIDQ